MLIDCRRWLWLQCGTEMVASQFVSEISSPLLHLREMLKEFGVRDTDLNLLVDVLFALTFSVARMGFGPYITYATVTADNPILIKVRIRWPNQPSSQQPPPPKSQQTLTRGMLCCARFARRWGRGCSSSAPTGSSGSSGWSGTSSARTRRSHRPRPRRASSPQTDLRRSYAGGLQEPPEPKLCRRRIRSLIRSETECCAYIPVVWEVLASDHVNRLCPLARAPQTGGAPCEYSSNCYWQYKIVQRIEAQESDECKQTSVPKRLACRIACGSITIITVTSSSLIKGIVRAHTK